MKIYENLYLFKSSNSAQWRDKLMCYKNWIKILVLTGIYLLMVTFVFIVKIPRLQAVEHQVI